MARSHKSRVERHHPSHTNMKRNYNRKMRRLVRAAMVANVEPPIKLAGFKNAGFCCGGHLSDWRY